MRHRLLLRRWAGRLTRHRPFGQSLVELSPQRADGRPGRHAHAFAPHSHGQAVVEFALIIPVFMLLLLLAVDFGRLFFTYIQLNNTAREGAAYAAANPTTDDPTLTTIALRESNVQAQSGEGAFTATAACVDSSGTALDCWSALGGAGAGNRVTVSVGETFNFFTPLIGSFWPGGLKVATSATAPVVDYAPGGGIPPPKCTTKPSTPIFTWSTPDATAPEPILSVDAGTSPNLASPCQNIGYNWDFAGASIDPTSDYLRAGITQTYQFATGGTYTVTLVVSNAAGDSPPFSKTITLGTATCKAPTATFTVSPAAIYKNGQIDNWVASNGASATKFTFDGSASAFMADPACDPVWSWDLGDGTTATTPIVLNHTYGQPKSNRTVTVKLTVTNKVGTAFTTVDLPLR